MGAISPSSPGLARALCTHFSRRTGPANVLEVGAGTGPVTRHIGSLLGPEDRLDVCEIQAKLADFLESSVLTTEHLAPAFADGRVRLLRAPVQEIDRENHYDFVIAGLPFTAFALRDIKDVFKVIRRCLKPGGVMSYFEYVALRRISSQVVLGSKRRRKRIVSAYMSRHIKNHQFDRQTVFQNVPPAYARHLRFD